MTMQELKKIMECSGKHERLTELFNCDSCAPLFTRTTPQPVKIEVQYIDTPVQYYKFLK